MNLPTWLRPMFVVSLDNDKYEQLQKRLGVWSTYMFRWVSPDPKTIESDWKTWVFKEKIRQQCNLSVDDIAYIDTHVSIWKDCVRRKQTMLVMDDTCTLSVDTPSVVETLEEAWRRIQNASIEFDFLYISHTNRHKPKQYITSFVDSPNVVIPTNVQGLSCYMITPKGATFLLKHVYPYELPLDVYVSRQADRDTTGTFRCYALYPSPF